MRDGIIEMLNILFIKQEENLNGKLFITRIKFLIGFTYTDSSQV